MCARQQSIPVCLMKSGRETSSSTAHMFNCRTNKRAQTNSSLSMTRASGSASGDTPDLACHVQPTRDSINPIQGAGQTCVLQVVRSTIPLELHDNCPAPKKCIDSAHATCYRIFVRHQNIILVWTGSHPPWDVCRRSRVAMMLSHCDWPRRCHRSARTALLQQRRLQHGLVS